VRSQLQQSGDLARRQIQILGQAAQAEFVKERLDCIFIHHNE